MRKGSMTVEAALVFPFIIMILIAIMSLGVYLHDTVCLKAIANQTAYRYSYNIEERETIENYVNELSKEMLIACGNDCKVEYKIDNRVIYKTLDIKISKPHNLAFGLLNIFLLRDFNKKSANIVIKSKAQIKNPTTVIRNIDLIDDLTDEITITSKYKKNYENNVKEIIKIIKNISAN